MPKVLCAESWAALRGQASRLPQPSPQLLNQLPQEPWLELHRIRCRLHLPEHSPILVLSVVVFANVVVAVVEVSMCNREWFQTSADARELVTRPLKPCNPSSQDFGTALHSIYDIYPVR